MLILVFFPFFCQCLNFIYDFSTPFNPFENQNITAMGTDSQSNIYVAYSDSTMYKYNSRLQFISNMNNLKSLVPISQINFFDSSQITITDPKMTPAQIIVGMSSDAKNLYIANVQTGLYIRKISASKVINGYHIHAIYINSVLMTFGMLGILNQLHLITTSSTAKVFNIAGKNIIDIFKTTVTITNTTLLIKSVYAYVVNGYAGFMFNTNYTFSLTTNAFSYSHDYSALNLDKRTIIIFHLGSLLLNQRSDLIVQVSKSPSSLVTVDSNLMKDLILQEITYLNNQYLIFNNSITLIKYDSVKNTFTQLIKQTYVQGSGYFHYNVTTPPFIWNKTHMFAMGQCLTNNVYNFSQASCQPYLCKELLCIQCPQTPFKCILCQLGYSISIQVCIKNICKAFCLLCEPNYFCILCQQNYTVSSTNSTICQVKIDFCQIGHSIINNTCVQNLCNTFCLSCQVNLTCFNCSQNYIVSSINSTICEEIIYSCQFGYSIINNTCVLNSCTEFCSFCAVNFFCYVCLQNYVINSKNVTICQLQISKKPSQSQNVLKNDTKIMVICEKGYNKKNNICEKNLCDHGCSWCEINLTCISCEEHFAQSKTDSTMCIQNEIIGETVRYTNSLDSILSCPNKTGQSSAQCSQIVDSLALRTNVVINQQLVKIPFLSRVLQWFSPVLLLNNNYWYYLYHNRNYSNIFWTNILFNLITFINTDRMNLINLTIIDSIYKQGLYQLFYSNYSLFTNPNVYAIEKSSSYFIFDIQDYFVWRFLLIIIFFVIGNLFSVVLQKILKILSFAKLQQKKNDNHQQNNQLKQAKIIKVKKYIFKKLSTMLFFFFNIANKGGTFILLIDQLFRQNLVFIGFSCSLQFKNCFSMIFADKVNNMLSYVFFFMALLYTCVFYFLSYSFQPQKAELLIQDNKNKKEYFLKTITVLINLFHGFMQGFFLDSYPTLMYCLIFLKLLNITTILVFKSIFFNCVTFIFNFTFSILILLFDIFLIMSYFQTDPLFYNYFAETLQIILLGGIILTIIFQIFILLIIITYSLLIGIVDKIKQIFQKKQQKKQKNYNNKKMLVGVQQNNLQDYSKQNLIDREKLDNLLKQYSEIQVLNQEKNQIQHLTINKKQQKQQKLTKSYLRALLNEKINLKQNANR